MSSSPRRCQAKFPAVCPYHGSIYYSTPTATYVKRLDKLVAKLDTLEARAQDIDFEVSASASSEMNRTRAEIIINSELLGATDEMRKKSKYKAVQEKRDNEDQGTTETTWKDKFFQAYRINNIQSKSETRFDLARQEIDATLFQNRTTKLKALAQAFRDEQGNLDADCAKEKWMASPDQADTVETAYFAVKYELNKFAEKLSWTTHEVGSPSSKQSEFFSGN